MQYGRFFTVGLIVGVIAIGLRELIGRALPADTPIYYSLSVILVYAIGILLSFVLHSRFTFGAGANDASIVRLASFSVVAMVGALITWLVSMVCRYQLGFDDHFDAASGAIAFAVGAVTASLATYVLNAHLVFRQRRTTGERPPKEPAR